MFPKYHPQQTVYHYQVNLASGSKWRFWFRFPKWSYYLIDIFINIFCNFRLKNNLQLSFLSSTALHLWLVFQQGHEKQLTTCKSHRFFPWLMKAFGAPGVQRWLWKASLLYLCEDVFQDGNKSTGNSGLFCPRQSLEQTTDGRLWSPYLPKFFVLKPSREITFVVLISLIIYTNITLFDCAHW